MSTSKFLVFSCMHLPLQDDEAVEFLESQIEEFKPDIIVSAGDDFEADASSRWPNEYSWTLKDEFVAFDRTFSRLRALGERVGTSRFVKLWGNHGDNIMSINRISKSLRDLVNPYEHCKELREWETPCQYVKDPVHGCFRIGQVTIAHGWESGVSSDEMQAIKFGTPYGLWISGHTHRPVPVRRAMKTKTCPLPYWYANPGTLRHMKPEYTKRNDTFMWGQGVVVGEAEHWRYQEQFIPRQVCWDAETRIFRMASGTQPEQADWRLPQV